MSYILDALRKSEQQRLAAGAPSLNSGQAAPLETGVAHRSWKVVAVVLLAINAGALGWWLASRPGAPVPPVHPPASAVLAPAPAQAPAAPARSAPMASPPSVEGAAPPPPVVALVEPPAPARAAQPSNVPTQPDPPFAARPPRPQSPPDAASATRAATPLPKPAPQSSLPAAPARPPPEPEESPALDPRNGIMTFADLPASIRKTLPPLQIGGYVEGAGTDAMLIVDDRLVHEGDEIGGGVRVLKIAPDGAVFSYRNYRFRR
jgi:general secretion pathway protein B